MGSKKEFRKNRQVFVRILPTTDMCHDSIKVEKNLKACTTRLWKENLKLIVIYVRCLQDYHTNNMQKCANPNFWCFKTDGIMHNASQEHVYSLVMNDVIESVLKGCNAVVMAYGQTGSGKSFTISGLHNNYLHRGLVPRLISQFFEVRNARRRDSHIRYHMSFVEICGDHIRDLLAKSPKSFMRHESLKNIKVLPITSENVALKLIFEGEGRRRIITSAPYKSSNQGHSILTFYTECKSLLRTEAVAASAKLQLVDLAGVDCYGNPTSHWKSKEDVGSANLNKSLLEQFLIQLSIQPSKSYNGVINHRLSKLIQYISDCLSPSCILRFIGHIRGTYSDIRSTLSTLRFGNKLLGVKCSALQFNVQPLPTMIIRNLEEQVNDLSDQILLMNMLSDQPSLNNISQGRVEQMQRLAVDYLQGQDKELTVMNVGQFTVVLQVFKDLYSKLDTEKEQLREKVAVLIASEEASQQKTKSLSPTKTRMKRSVKREEVLSSTMSQSEPSPNNVQVGETDRSGIGIGPGKISSFEGITTRATKRQRNLNMGLSPKKMSKDKEEDHKDTVVSGLVAVPPSEFECNVKNVITENNDAIFPLPDNLPFREEAWQSFMSTESALGANLQANVNNQSKIMAYTHKSYLVAVTQITESRVNLDVAKAVLAQAQNERHIQGKELYDADGRITISKSEHKCLEHVLQQEAALTQAHDKVMIKKLELEIENHKLIEMKQKLEDAFQNFCTRNYHSPVPQVEVCQEQTQVKEQPQIQPPFHLSDVCDQQTKIYQRFQREILNKDQPKHRKLWV